MSQSAIEQNHGTTREKLAEAGFEGIVSKPLSQFTVMLHTRTLDAGDERRFREWAEEQPHVFFEHEDLDGYIYRWNI